jgi:hypothetical protein
VTRAIAALLIATALVGGGCAGLERRPEGPQGFAVDITQFVLDCLRAGGLPVGVYVTNTGALVRGACLLPKSEMRPS